MQQDQSTLCEQISAYPPDVVSNATQEYCCDPAGLLPNTSTALICQARVYIDANTYMASEEVLQGFNSINPAFGTKARQAPPQTPPPPPPGRPPFPKAPGTPTPLPQSSSPAPAPGPLASASANRKLQAAHLPDGFHGLYGAETGGAGLLLPAPTLDDKSGGFAGRKTGDLQSH